MLTIILFSFGAFLSTLIGGLLAIRFKDRLHIIVGFSAGAVIGVAFFDLIPEAFELGYAFHSYSTIAGMIALGFLSYLVLDRLVLLHTHEEGCEAAASTERGAFGAGSISIHSFLDGIAIGLAFQISSAVGLLVAVAILIHDFSDGINTVNFILKNDGSRTRALLWLFIDAVAPVLGAISTFFFVLPELYLSVVLALFAGFFLYIGASDLIPESHHAHPTFLTTIMTLLGCGVLYVAIHIASL